MSALDAITAAAELVAIALACAPASLMAMLLVAVETGPPSSQ